MSRADSGLTRTYRCRSPDAVVTNTCGASKHAPSQPAVAIEASSGRAADRAAATSPAPTDFEQCDTCTVTTVLPS